MLELLKKDGKKSIRNVLLYLNDPSLIKNPSQITKLSKRDYRIQTVFRNFRNLDNLDKNEIKEYLSDNIRIIQDLIYSLEKIDTVNFEKDIDLNGFSSFMYEVSSDIDESAQHKLLEWIFINNEIYVDQIINNEVVDIKKEKIIDFYSSYNVERGYILSLLNKFTLNRISEIDVERLVDEICNLQSNNDKLILRLVLNDYEDKDTLLEQVSFRLNSEDYNMYYAIVKDFRILDDFNFKVDRENILFLKWLLDNQNDNKYKIKEYLSNMNNISQDFIANIASKFLLREELKQEIAILLVEHLLSIGMATNLKDKLSSNVIEVIINNKKNRDDLLLLLFKMDPLQGMDMLIKIVEEVGYEILKNTKIRDLVKQRVLETNEYEWIISMQNRDGYYFPKFNLNKTIVTLILINESPKVIYTVLKLIEKNDHDLFNSVLVSFSNLVEIKYVESKDKDKFIKLLIVLDYQNRNEKVINLVNQFKEENIESLNQYRQIIDPDLLLKNYFELIEDLLSKNLYEETIKIQDEIENIEDKRKCSKLILDKLLVDDIYIIKDFWDKLSLDASTKLDFKRTLYGKLIGKDIVLNEDIIIFMNKLGFETMELIRITKEKEHIEFLLNYWKSIGDNGKIITYVREIVLKNSNSIDRIEDAKSILDKYNLNDRNMEILIKLKAYDLIVFDILEGDFNINTFNLADGMLNKLIYFNLEERFIEDKLIQNELDERFIDYILKYLIKAQSSEKMIKYFWNKIEDDFSQRRVSFKGNLDVLLSEIIRSRENIETFLDVIENSEFSRSMYLEIIENLLYQSLKRNRINSQLMLEKVNQEEATLNKIGNSISNSLSNLEKALINRYKDSNDVLIEIMKRFRQDLETVGIYPVESIENLGKIVDFDYTKHDQTHIINQKGIVDSIGVKVNDVTLSLSTLLNIG